VTRFAVKIKKKVVAESGVPEIDIGTQSDCVVSIEDPIAAAQHAHLSYEEDGSFVIRDIHTATGTHVNGLPVTGPTKLESGDVIVVGQSRLTCTIVTHEEAPPPPEVEEGEESPPPPEPVLREGGPLLELLLAEKSFYAAKTDADEWVRNEVRFGRYAPMRAGNWVMILASILLVGAALIPPISDPLLEPGDLISAHADLFDRDVSEFHGNEREWAEIAQAEGCSVCHDPWDRTPISKCATCHEDLMRDQHPFRTSTVTGAGLAAGSRGFDETACLSCHVDHRGREPGEGVFKPTPGQMSGEDAADSGCAICHPADAMDGFFQLDRIARLLPDIPHSVEVGVAYQTFPHDAHLATDPAIDCQVCHVVAEEGAREDPTAGPGSIPQPGNDRALHEFASVPFETCDACHAADESRRDPELAQYWEGMGAEFAYQVDWHGTDDSNGGESNCTQCHPEVGVEDLSTVASADVDWLEFSVDRRTHEEVFAEHAAGRECAECHADTSIFPETAGASYLFRHGVHMSSLWPDSSGEVGLSAECLDCHREQADAHGLAEGLYLGASEDGCADCHRDASGAPLALAALDPRTSAGGSEQVSPRVRTDFPHAAHVGDELMGGEGALAKGCFECHSFDAGAELYSALPVTTAEASSCMPCHQTHDNVAGGACADCHAEGDPSYGGEPMVRTWPELNAFEHMSPGHREWSTGEGESCQGCHTGLEGATSITEIPIPLETDAACRDCHITRRQRFHWR